MQTFSDKTTAKAMSSTSHVKFVKIPEKYSPDLLEKARASCK